MVTKKITVKDSRDVVSSLCQQASTASWLGVSMPIKVTVAMVSTNEIRSFKVTRRGETTIIEKA